MEIKEPLKNLIIKFGNYYEEERQDVINRLNEMNEIELIESIENMIKYYIQKQLN